MAEIVIIMKTDDKSPKYGQFSYDQEISVEETDAIRFVQRRMAIYKPKPSAKRKETKGDVSDGGE